MSLGGGETLNRRTLQPLLTWGFLLLGAILGWQQLLPHVLPFRPENWSLTRSAARAQGVEILRELGGWPEDPLIVVRLVSEDALERRLRSLDRVPQTLRKRLRYWEVSVYPPQAVGRAWTHQAWFALDGSLLQLLRNPSPTEGAGSLTVEEAVELASNRLAEFGILLPPRELPEIRRSDLEHRSDLELRFREPSQDAPAPFPYGFAVRFAGREFVGFALWIEDPELRELEAQSSPLLLLGNLQFFSNFFLLPVLTVLFFHRYHAGEVGVRRSLGIFSAVLLPNVIVLLLTAFGATEGLVFGTLTRSQLAWTRTWQTLLLFYGPLALVSFFAWSVGEVLCRERWAVKLAAFDAFFQGRLENRTVALASLRGFSTGWALAFLLLLSLNFLSSLGIEPTSSFPLGPFWNQGPAMGFLGVLFIASYTLAVSLAGRHFLVSWLSSHVGTASGFLLATVFGAFLFFEPVTALPWPGAVLLALLVSAGLNLLFLRYDLLTSWIAFATVYGAFSSSPLLSASHPSIQLQGWVLALAPGLPLFLSLRFLGSEQEFQYRWEDVPSHVRRIAERERQRLELETARSIQAAILPPLPSSLVGCELAVHYTPATEVGGDFYAALALPGNKLALALGDVAGHGVPAGLIMSMVRAALEVQVAYDPSVSQVIQRLNQLVYTRAQRRHLVTLCYGTLEPVRRVFEFGCAGQVFPYCLREGGGVLSLESVAYPLGVRAEWEGKPRTIELQPGDRLLLVSDGAIELGSSQTEEAFGFERMEALLQAAPPGSAQELITYVQRALERFRSNGPQEDDLTLLAVKIP